MQQEEQPLKPVRAKRGRPNDHEVNEWGLTPAQEAYCNEYIQDFNKTQAAIRAGYSKGGAKRYCMILHAMPEVRTRIDELLASRRATYSVNNDRLQEEISRIAFSDATAIFDYTDPGFQTLTVEGLRKMPARVKAAIKGIKATKYGLEVQFHSKEGALEMLAKHLGYFEKDNEQKKTDGIALYLPVNGRGDEEIPEES